MTPFNTPRTSTASTLSHRSYQAARLNHQRVEESPRPWALKVPAQQQKTGSSSCITDLIKAQRYIDSFARPQGFNTHAWRVVKKLALKAWDAYLENATFQQPINFLCKEFYDMIRTPEGELIIPRERIRSPFV